MEISKMFILYPYWEIHILLSGITPKDLIIGGSISGVNINLCTLRHLTKSARIVRLKLNCLRRRKKLLSPCCLKSGGLPVRSVRRKGSLSTRCFTMPFLLWTNTQSISTSSVTIRLRTSNKVSRKWRRSTKVNLLKWRNKFLSSTKKKIANGETSSWLSKIIEYSGGRKPNYKNYILSKFGKLKI